MSGHQGYYSIIQYCPDRSRMETANIGVILICPAMNFVRALVSKNNDRIRRFFRGESLDLARIKAAKRAIEKRVDIDRGSFRSPEHLVRFIDTRGNDILLTPPRSMRVMSPETEIDQLFEELVGGRIFRRHRAPELPELDLIFRRPTLQSRVLFDQTISVPVLERQFRVPYAYRNGVMNLVKPQHFDANETEATHVAMRLAIEGDLLQRHQVGGREHRLVIVPTFEHLDKAALAKSRVSSLFEEYRVRVVHVEQLDQFGVEVESQAHS